MIVDIVPRPIQQLEYPVPALLRHKNRHMAIFREPRVGIIDPLVSKRPEKIKKLIKKQKQN